MVLTTNQYSVPARARERTSPPPRRGHVHAATSQPWRAEPWGFSPSTLRAIDTHTHPGTHTHTMEPHRIGGAPHRIQATDGQGPVVKEKETTPTRGIELQREEAGE